MSFNIEFRKHGMAEGYLECAPRLPPAQIHAEGCHNDPDLEGWARRQKLLEWEAAEACECPYTDPNDVTIAILPFDCELKGICLTAFTPSDADAVIEFKNKTVEMPYNGAKINTLNFDLDVANPKKGQGVRVRLTKPTKHPLVTLTFQ